MILITALDLIGCLSSWTCETNNVILFGIQLRVDEHYDGQFLTEDGLFSLYHIILLIFRKELKGISIFNLLNRVGWVERRASWLFDEKWKTKKKRWQRSILFKSLRGLREVLFYADKDRPSWSQCHIHYCKIIWYIS